MTQVYSESHVLKIGETGAGVPYLYLDETTSISAMKGAVIRIEFTRDISCDELQPIVARLNGAGVNFVVQKDHAAPMASS